MIGLLTWEEEARAAGIEEGRRLERDGQLAAFLEWRGVEEACERCQGRGMRVYGDTTTWSGGAGGQMATLDVCNLCWGTGDKTRRGVDLRRLRSATEDAREEGRRQMREEVIAEIERLIRAGYYNNETANLALLSAINEVEVLPVKKEGDRGQG